MTEVEEFVKDSEKMSPLKTKRIPSNLKIVDSVHKQSKTVEYRLHLLALV